LVLVPIALGLALFPLMETVRKPVPLDSAQEASSTSQ
jgi:hypothetical protein